MKKIFNYFVLALILNIVVGFTSVNAMTEDELYQKFSKSYDINGAVYKVKESDKVLIRRYLDQNEVSAADCDYVSSKIDEAINTLRASGTTNVDDFSKLSKATKEKLKKIVQDIASSTSIKATVTGGALVVYNSDGSVFAEISKIVKNTGTNINLYIIIASITILLGSIVLIKNGNQKKKKIQVS